MRTTRRAMLTVATIASIAIVAVGMTALLQPASAAPGDTLSGQVFRDENWSGTNDTEIGEPGIEVTVTDTLGAIAGPFTSTADGSWASTAGSLDAMTGPYIIQFVVPASAAPLQPGPVGADNASDVQFSPAGATDIDFGVVWPTHYCGDNPDVALNCYQLGDQTGGGDVLVRTEYLATGDGLGGGTAETGIADAPDIGTTWGLAIQTFDDRDTSNDVIWAAAFEKRFSGYAPGGAGPDTIFKVSQAGTVLDTVTIEAGTDSHDFSLVAGGGGPEIVDGASYALVGKQGWGDVDISDDQTKLYAVNMLDSRLYEIDVDTASGTYLSPLQSWSLSALGACGATLRPGAVGVHEGLVYVGTTCDDASNAYVHHLDPSTGTFTAAVTIPLGYTREPIGNATGLLADWRAWNDTYAGDITGWGGIEVGNPQPWLLDIEFDRGSLVLGLRDRYGDQGGRAAATPSWPGDTTLASVDGGGDTLRACRTAALTWALEGSAGCAVSNGGAASSGPGGAEWYDGDQYLLSGGAQGHGEISSAGLAVSPNTGTVLSTGYDTLDDIPSTSYAFSSGLMRLDNTSGDKVGQYRVIDGDFGKASGLGDVEAFCLAAPVEIGNYVWLDIDQDGLQDPGEEPLVGVVVTLVGTDASGAVNPSVVTGADGSYSFQVEPGTAYSVTFDPSAATAPSLTDPALLVVTSLDSGSDDELDSDATVSGGLITIDLTTGAPGANDHSFDVGLHEAGFRLGNLVWLDPDDSGTADDGELGIAGIEVELYLESGDAVGFDGLDTLASSAITDSVGNYWFAVLDGETYYVGIPTDQSGNTVTVDPGSGAVAIDPTVLMSSTGIDPADSDNDNTDDGDAATGFITLSGPVDIGDATEPTAEADINATPDRDAEAHVEGPGGAPDLPDNDSNLTVDLSLKSGIRVGNLVWRDGESGDVGFDNGVADAAEAAAGIGTVTLELFSDTGAAGVFEPSVDTLVATTTTDASGNYFFDIAAAGDYFVAVPSDQTGQTLGGGGTDLETLIPSTPAPSDADAELDDVNDGAATAGYASVSSVFSVARGDNPSNEAGDFNTGAGTEAEDVANSVSSYYIDANSDLSIDFGFIEVPLYEIGNLVWMDSDNDGVAETGEMGIEGVAVQLWRDTDADGAGDVLVDTQNTDADGHYLFDNLAPGDYVVVIPSDQSGATIPTALDDKVSSSNGEEADPDSDADNNDNGVTDLTGSGPVGIGSGVLTLGEGSGTDEPTDETVRADDATADDSPTGLADDQSNLSVDFGFYGLTLGNLVWFDLNTDAVADAGEPAAVGVTMNLWQDTDTDGTLDVLIDSTTTDVAGHYLFTGLAEGTYAVEVDASNFADGGALGGWLSTFGAAEETDPDADIDSNDNGIDPATPGDAVFSGLVDLAAATEPTDETDVPAGHDSPSDANANVSVDFGFYQLALGNRVWLDTDNDGQIDDDEDGVGDVMVQLFLDTNSDGSPDSGTPLQTSTTDDDGYYLFEGLEPGDYVVVIPSKSFDPGGPLHNTFSSTPTTTDAEGGTDSDDNGIDPAAVGDDVLSSTVTLTPNTEPSAETDVDGTQGTDDDNIDLTIDFGFFELSSLGDKVYDDDDGDGIEDDGENGVPGVTVRVFNEDGDEVGSDVTDDDGMYLIEGLLPGAVVVEFDLSTIPEGSSVGPGTVTVDPNTGRTGEIELGVGENNLTIDLGLLDVDSGAGGLIPFTGSNTGRPVIFALALLSIGWGLVELQRQRGLVMAVPTGARHAGPHR